MKIHSNCRILIFASLIFFGSSIPSTAKDIYESQRVELKQLYQTSFDSCEIVRTVYKDFPGAGKYMLFETSCSEVEFPVLLDYEMSSRHTKLFKAGAILFKNANSYQLEISTEGAVNQTLIRRIDFESQDDSIIGIVILIWVVAMSFFFFYLKRRKR